MKTMKSFMPQSFTSIDDKQRLVLSFIGFCCGILWSHFIYINYKRFRKQQLRGRRGGREDPVHMEKDVGTEGNLVSSTIHSLLTVSCSWIAVIYGNLWTGTFACTYSAGYMCWDIYAMIDIEYPDMKPLFLHHMCSGLSMIYIGCFESRAVWYACFLLITESTVPIKNYVDWIEGLKTDRNNVVPIWTRWLLLCTWILFRIVLFVPFALTAWREWHTFTSTMKFLAFNGPFLFLFNIAGLFTVILKGFPWTTATETSRLKKL